MCSAVVLRFGRFVHGVGHTRGFAAGRSNSSPVHPDDALTSAYTFDLPKELIAQSHARPRDASRLLVMRPTGLEHARFSDLPRYLRHGDLVVLNETKVFAARLFGRREGSGGRVELLLLRPADGQRYDPSARRWQALVRPGRAMPLGQRVDFEELGCAHVVGIHENGVREIELTLAVAWDDFLARAGRLPLPPYISNGSQEAQEDYQTIFARTPGSVAAPTASLHFTGEVLLALEEAGVQTARLCLDVGLGTFSPVKAVRLDKHCMHEETFDIPPETATAIARAKTQGRRIIAAGTTVMRALEGSAHKHGTVSAGPDRTSLFISPGFRFAVVNGLITNFHLPQSSLLVLVSAFAGRQAVLAAYHEAVSARYRFFSFGDAMLIEPE